MGRPRYDREKLIKQRRSMLACHPHHCQGAEAVTLHRPPCSPRPTKGRTAGNPAAIPTQRRQQPALSAQERIKKHTFHQEDTMPTWWKVPPVMVTGERTTRCKSMTAVKKQLDLLKSVYRTLKVDCPKFCKFIKTYGNSCFFVLNLFARERGGECVVSLWYYRIDILVHGGSLRSV